MIYGNAVMAPAALKTVILEDGNGNEVTGVVVGEETVFTATVDDIKIGKIAAIDSGIVEGKDTKTYRTYHATKLISPGDNFSIPLEKYEQYNYTKFQAMIAEFNTNQYDSTSVSKISVNDAVYNVNSNSKVSDVTKNPSSKSIDLNIINNTDKIFCIFYNTYKEE